MPYSARPPGLMSRLKMMTSCPPCAIFCAANIPAGPAPTTNTVLTQSSWPLFWPPMAGRLFWQAYDYIVVADAFPIHKNEGLTRFRPYLLAYQAATCDIARQNSGNRPVELAVITSDERASAS